MAINCIKTAEGLRFAGLFFKTLHLPDGLRLRLENDGAEAFVEPIPVSSWNGKGVPPTGTTCEAQWKNPRGTDTRLHKCMIIHVDSEDEAVALSFESGMSLCPFWIGAVRPIRTSEQIAADERDTIVEDIFFVMTGHHDRKKWADTNYERFAELIHDAGYRKP